MGEARCKCCSDAPTCTCAMAHLPALFGATLLSPVSWCATLLVVQTQVTPCLQQLQHDLAAA